jgi:hypothetical protein
MSGKAPLDSPIAADAIIYLSFLDKSDKKFNSRCHSRQWEPVIFKEMKICPFLSIIVQNATRNSRFWSLEARKFPAPTAKAKR